MSKKHSKWYYHTPGMIYAGNIDFNRPVSAEEVKQELRERWEVKRLPNGTAVWPYSPLPDSGKQRDYADLMWM